MSEPVFIFRTEPEFPNAEETQIANPVAGSIFDSLADYANYLDRYAGLRWTPIILRPFVRERADRLDLSVVADPQVRYIPFLTSSHTTELFVSLGYSHVSNDGDDAAYAQITVREEPVPNASGQFTPGTGAEIDPGCKWQRVRGDLPNAAGEREYGLAGLQWVHTGLADPPQVITGDPPTATPRVLVVPPQTRLELELTWESVLLNAVVIWERFNRLVTP